MSYYEMERTIACQQMEIDDLRAQLKEAQAEIEHLKRSREHFAIHAQSTLCQLAASQARISELEMKLAASQANEVQLRDDFRTYIDEHEECTDADDWMAMTCSIEAHHVADEAISLPSDTTALEKLVLASSEVMREKCINATIEMIQLEVTLPIVRKEIRDLPGVTLQDLQNKSEDLK